MQKSSRKLRAPSPKPQPKPVGRLACKPEGPAAPELQLLLVQVLETLRLAVVHGGNKTDRGAVLRQAQNPRSWKSYELVARDIAAALERIGFGNVAIIADDMRLGKQLRDRRINMAWLNSGGVQGRSAIAHAPAMLEMFGIPYVGHDPLTAGLLDSKHHFKRQLLALGIPTAPYVVCDPHDLDAARIPDATLKSVFGAWPHGFVVKPVTGRASLHVHYVQRAAQLPSVIRHVFNATRNSVLVEAFLPGREYCVAVAGPVIAQSGKLRHLSAPFAFSGLERKLADDEPIFTSMDVKPITAARTRVLDQPGDRRVLARLESIARQVYTGTPLQTLVRLDVRADDKGELYVLEANPKPDLAAPRAAATSLICLGLAQHGMSYDDLILSVVANRLAGLFDGRQGSVSQFIKSFQHSKRA